MMRWFLLVLVAPALALAQDYYEASGRTVAFTLAPGAKAAWNQPVTPVKPLARLLAATPLKLSIRYTAGELRLAGTGAGRLRLQNLRGQEAGTYPVDISGIARPAGKLGSGVWLARFEGLDGRVRTGKLAVMGGGQ